MLTKEVLKGWQKSILEVSLNVCWPLNLWH